MLGVRAVARKLWRVGDGYRADLARTTGSSTVTDAPPRRTLPQEGWSRIGRGTRARYWQLLALGRSDVSSVTLAVCQNAEGLSQLVALKTLSDARLRDDEARRHLLDEARLTARMNHPNVVKVYGVQYHDSIPAIVMEYLEGQSLATLLGSAHDRPDFTLELRVAIIARLLRGLDYAHRLRDFNGELLRVVHGGICPANVVITYDGEVKLIDFGRAKLQAGGTDNQHARSSLPYVAPEQLRGDPDHRADIFSAGVLLWELIVNRPLWDRTPTSTVVRRLLAGDIPRLREAAPRVDATLERICARALAPQAERRYRSVGKMREELEKYLAGRNVSISESAIGTLVRNACREQRQETQRVISARLSGLGLSLTRRADSSGWSANLRWSALATRVSPRALAAAAIVMAIPLVWLASSADPASSIGEAPPIATVHAPQKAGDSPSRLEVDVADPSSSFVRRIKLDVNVTPPHATLYLDDHRIPSNLLSAALIWDPYVHTVRSEAHGFDQFTTSFRLDSDLTINAALRAKVPEEGKPREGRIADVVGARPSKGLPSANDDSIINGRLRQ
jgi:eukaryotic-like serine/threonine-protein kinase